MEARLPKKGRVPDIGSRVRVRDYMNSTKKGAAYIEGEVDLRLSKQFRIALDNGGYWLAFYNDEWEYVE